MGNAGGDKVDFNKKRMQMQEGIVKNLKFLGQEGQPLPAGKSGKVPQYMARMNSRTCQYTTSAPEGVVKC
jgi:hypothetical protein